MNNGYYVRQPCVTVKITKNCSTFDLYHSSASELGVYYTARHCTILCRDTECTQHMSDAAMKVDPDFYDRRLIDSTEAGGGGIAVNNSMRQNRVEQPRRPLGGGMMHDDNRPDLPDYLIRQHSLLGLYLSLNPNDEGTLIFRLLSVRAPSYQIRLLIARFGTLDFGDLWSCVLYPVFCDSSTVRCDTYI